MVTTGGRNDAERLGEALVVEHLAGGCSVIPTVHSVYYWAGQLNREHGSPNGNGSAAETISPSTPAEAPMVSVAVLPELESPVTQAVLVEAPAPEPDEFKDLLGQAVGLRLDSVSREFGRGDEMHVSALQNVSLEIGPCEFVSVVGPSGCGNTTLLSLIVCLDKPTSGHVYAP